jgi:hypothetical protein
LGSAWWRWNASAPYTFQVYDSGVVKLLFAGVTEGEIAC